MRLTDLPLSDFLCEQLIQIVTQLYLYLTHTLSHLSLLPSPDFFSFPSAQASSMKMVLFKPYAAFVLTLLLTFLSASTIPLNGPTLSLYEASNNTLVETPASNPSV